MSKRDRGFFDFSTEVKAKIIAIVMAIIAIASPFTFSYYYEAYDGIYVIQMTSLIWIHWSNVLPTIIFFPNMLVNNLINTLLRFLFVFEIYRWYLGKTTKRRAFYVGLAGEVYQSCIMAYTLSFSLFSPIFEIFAAPIPLLLIAGLIILVTIKPHELPGLWIEKTNENDERKSDEFLHSE